MILSPTGPVRWDVSTVTLMPPLTRPSGWLIRFEPYNLVNVQLVVSRTLNVTDVTVGSAVNTS